MDLTVSNNWYLLDEDSIISDAYEFDIANLDEYEITVRPADEILYVEASEARLGDANCESGIHFDWSDVEGLCGKADVEIIIDSVMHEGLPNELSRAEDIRVFNDWLADELEDYDGYSAEWDIPGEYLAPFVDTRVDFRFTIYNCLGDREQVRRFLWVIDEDIEDEDIEGNTIIHRGGTCGQYL